MRRPALLLLAAMGCSFDASGFGEPPASSSGAPSSSTGPGSVGSSGGEPTTADETVGASGSGSMSGSSGGEVTTEPVTSTEPGTTTGPGTTSEPGTTSGTSTGSGTTGPGTTTEPCETMMVWVDADGDTFGDPGKPTAACVGEWDGVANNMDDCNDAAAAAYPGAMEVCDEVDNDCDTLIDEYDAKSNKDMCHGCAFRVRDQRLYYFCSAGMEWTASRGFCVGKKLDLAIDSDMGEHDWLVDRIDEFGDWDDLWWLGARQDGAFKWIDGATVANDSRWGFNQPDNVGLNFLPPADCLGLLGDKWHDDGCDKGRKFVCEGPVP